METPQITLNTVAGLLRHRDQRNDARSHVTAWSVQPPVLVLAVFNAALARLY
jgi:hypothetical protein